MGLKGGKEEKLKKRLDWKGEKEEKELKKSAGMTEDRGGKDVEEKRVGTGNRKRRKRSGRRETGWD